MSALAAAPRAEVETTLLVHPGVLTTFADYNDFLPAADALVRRLGLLGVVTISRRRAAVNGRERGKTQPLDSAENARPFSA